MNFSWIKQKLDLEWNLNEMRKPFRKNFLKKQKNTGNQCQIAAGEQKTFSENAIFLLKHHFLF